MKERANQTSSFITSKDPTCSFYPNDTQMVQELHSCHSNASQKRTVWECTPYWSLWEVWDLGVDLHAVEGVLNL